MRTRKPTGEAGWPMLLVEGKEKTRKTTEVLRLTADPRIGSAFVIEVGERRVDEYGALGRFEVVVHDGTLRDIVQSIRDVMAMAPTDGRPNVLIIDSLTGLWDLVKRKAEEYARSSKAAQDILERDPHATIDIKHASWNKAKDPYWWSWLNDLRAWPGIALLTARADEVSKFEDGRPVANQTDYRVELESGTRFIVDGQVRMRGARPPLLVTAASLKFTVPDEGIELPNETPLAHLVFGMFECGTAVTLDRGRAAGAVVAACVALGDDDTPTDDDPEAKRTPAKVRAGRVWRSIYPSVSPTEFDADAMRVLLDAVAADHAAETAGQDGAVASDGDAGADGAGDGPETTGADLGADPEVDAGTPAGTETETTTAGDDPAPADDGARDLDDATLDRAPAEPSTVMDDPEAEATAYAFAYVDGKSKTSCVAELALRGIVASVRGADPVALRSQLADVIIDERLGRRPDPAPDLHDHGAPDAATVQGQLT